MNSESRKLFFVINPRSGTMKAGAHLLKMVSILSNAGFSVTVYPTKSCGDATEVVSALDNSYDTVVCCGGDGTLNEVIAGMMKNRNNYKIGYIPAGTLNEWSLGLHIPRNLVEATRRITDGRLVKLDIGTFDDRYFGYAASFGALTEASYSANQQAKNVLGQAAYFFEGIRWLGNIKPVHLNIEYDGGSTEGDYIFGAVSNSLSVGGVIKLKESIVNLSDGLFEVALIKNPKNAIEFQALIGSIIAQNLNDPRIELFHTSSLVVTGESEMNWTLDGEMATGGKRVEIKNIHQAMEFYVPDEEIKILA